MKYYFSPSNLSFYPEELLDDYKKSNSLPTDVVAVTEAVYAKYIGIPPKGKQRGVIDGLPGWVDIPPPTTEQLKASFDREKTELMDDAEAMIKMYERIVRHGLAIANEETMLEKWERYSIDLSRLEFDPEKPTDWPLLPE